MARTNTHTCTDKTSRQDVLFRRACRNIVPPDSGGTGIHRAGMAGVRFFRFDETQLGDGPDVRASLRLDQCGTHFSGT